MLRHLRLLIGLRWKYLWRGPRGQRFGFLFTLLFACGVGFVAYTFVSGGLAAGFRRFDDQPRVMWEFVTIGFSVLYVLWLYLGSISDMYDPGRLAPFPVAPRTIFLGSTLAGFAGAALPITIGLIAGTIGGLRDQTGSEAIARSGLLVLFVLHLQMVGRLMRLLFLGLLTSRRWRDATILISTLIGGGFYVLHLLIRRGDMQDAAAAIEAHAEAGDISNWLAWSPAAWLSWAFSLEGTRAWIGLGAFTVTTIVVLFAGGWAERRLAFSEPVFHYKKRKGTAKREHGFLRGWAKPIAALFGPEAGAVARKELSIFFRDPTIRHRIIANLFYVLLPLVVPLLARSSIPVTNSSQFTSIASPVVLFAELVFLTNVFGTDGSAIRTMLGFPADRKKILLGKNLAYFVLFAPFNLVIMVAAWMLMAKQSGAAPLVQLPMTLGFHLASLVVVMAVGNVCSVFFPLRLLAPGQRVQRVENDGCMVILLRIVSLLVLMILVAPVALAAFALGMFGPVFTLLALPLAAAYAGVLYYVGLEISSRALRDREERLGDYFRAA